MRFMMIRRSDAVSESGALPNPEVFAAMGQYADAMAKAGVLVTSDGLKPSSAGTRVKFSAASRSSPTGRSRRRRS